MNPVDIPRYRLGDLSAEFSRTFKHPSIHPLPRLLSQITSSSSGQQSQKHFYASVVRSEELIPIFTEVVIWLLKKDLLVTLHLRIRVVVTPELKVVVREEMKKRREKKSERDKEREKEKEGGKEEDTLSGTHPPPDRSPEDYFLRMSPKTARRHTRKLSLSYSHKSHSSADEKERLSQNGSGFEYEEEDEDVDVEDDDSASMVSDDSGSPEWDRSSIICDPARATRLERAWLDAMSIGQDEHIVKRFEK